jgi:lipopolysaccharide heptosyltransferase II
MSRTLVVQTAWLGDMLLTTPLLAALANEAGPVDVVTTPAAVPLIETNPAVRRVWPYDKRGDERGPAAVVRLARRLRAAGFTTAVLPQGSFRSGLLAWAAGIPRRVTFAGTAAAWLCTERRPRCGHHETERLLGLADIGRPTALTLIRTTNDERAADAALARAGIAGSFVVLAPGSARPTKRWPYYGALAAALARDVHVVVLGGAREGFAFTTRGEGFRTVDLTGLPLRVSAAILARGRVAVVNDSAMLHLAQATSTPVVALFGPTHPSLGFGPRGPRDRTLGLALACRPCSTHGGERCPLGHHRCLRDLPVARVMEAVQDLLTAKEVLCV